MVQLDLRDLEALGLPEVLGDPLLRESLAILAILLGQMIQLNHPFLAYLEGLGGLEGLVHH